MGNAEFSDTPMPQPPQEDLYLDFFKAKHTTKYLEDYTDSHSHDGQTLRSRIRFGTEVMSIDKPDDVWVIATRNVETGISSTFHGSNLMVASGLTSVPYMPRLPGRDNFQGPIIHSEAFGSSTILTSPNVSNISVLGGGKSSADMIYTAVKAGKKVTWLLKATDTAGPGFFLSPKGKGPYKNAFEVAMTRAASTFTPSFMNGETWWTRLLHSSTYGVKLMNSFWSAIDKDTRREPDYEHRKNVGGFDKLNPHTPSVVFSSCHELPATRMKNSLRL